MVDVLSDADYAAWDPEKLARHIGYLPQDSILFAGTIKENISRFAGSLADATDMLTARAMSLVVRGLIASASSMVARAFPITGASSTDRRLLSPENSTQSASTG